MNNSTHAASPDPAMIIRTVNSGGFIRANSAFRKAIGLEESELNTKPFLDWISPEDHEQYKALLKGNIASCRIRHKTKGGGFFPLNIAVTDTQEGQVLLCRDGDTQPVSQTSDSTAEEVTVKSTLRTIAHIVEEQEPGFKCSILLVADGRFVSGAGPSLPEDYNSAIDGYAVGPTVGSCGTAIYWGIPVIAENLQTDPLWKPFAELTKKAGISSCWSHPFVSKGGRVLGALAFYSPVPRAPTQDQLKRLKSMARLAGLAVERGRAEEALRKQQKREHELEEQLRQAAKMEALGVLAGGVAHDFNNVLATILANTEYAQMLLPPESEVHQTLSKVITASQRAGNFCQQMLTYAGRGSMETSRIEIGKILTELPSLMKAALSKKASLQFIAHKEPTFIEGDENQLMQVVMNLVTNAADAIGDNEGKIIVSSDVAHYESEILEQLGGEPGLASGDYVRITVSDTGCGMDKEVQSRIFDPFYSTKRTGRGLGLSAVKGIVRKHKGVIFLESTVGKGTTFTLLLPKSNCQTVAPTAAIPLSSEKYFSTKQILLAEDEPDLREVLMRILNAKGFKVIEAEDGQRAVDLFKENERSIDCILLDMNMPKLNGDEVLKEIRSFRHDVPVIMMSGFSEHEIEERFQGNQHISALNKPIIMKDLISRISQTLTGEF